MNWHDITVQIQPALVNFLNAALGFGVLVLGLAGSWLAVKWGVAKQAETNLSQLQQGKEVAAVAVKAAQQNPSIQGNNAMKSSALETVKATVPDLGDHLHDKLVEAAVKDMKTEEAITSTVQGDVDMGVAG